MSRQSLSLLTEILFTRWWVRLAMVILSFMAAVSGILGPFFQKSFLDQLSGSSDFSTIRFEWMNQLSPIEMLLLSFVCLGLALMCYQLVILIGTFEAIHMQGLLSKKIYSKILTLKPESLQGKPIGEFVSIYTTDVPSSTILLEQSLPQGLSILISLALGPWVLVQYFDVPFTFLGPLLAIVVGINLYMALRQSRFFFRFKTLAADRVGFVNEWIQNIRALRILGWMESFESQIFQVRRIETENRIQMLNNGQTMNAMTSSLTFILNIAIVSFLVLALNQPLSSGTLMALLWIVGVFMTRPFRQLPWFFTFIFDGWTSIERVASVLELSNRQSSLNISPSESSAEAPPANSFPKLNILPPAIQISRLNLTIQNRVLLSDIDLKIPPGEFLAIVGEVGSGKSLLLQSLLGETGAQIQSYQLGDRNALDMKLMDLRSYFSFVPQEGFIISGTLRENVAFEYDIPTNHDERILKSLSLAQFQSDTEKLEKKLDTEIGERGVNLSGGQKQRVSLARVDYSQAPIMLLDDCLSAVDVNTESYLIRDLLNGAWKDKTRILVTHRLTVLEYADRVLFLKDGKIAGLGPLKELFAHNPEFCEYATSLSESRNNSRPHKEPLLESSEPPESI